jgi:hypothetical protein
MDGLRDERSSPRLSDEELEYFGELYVRCRISEAGLPFTRYLESPEFYLQKHARDIWRGKPRPAKPRGLARFFRMRTAEPTGEA